MTNLPPIPDIWDLEARHSRYCMTFKFLCPFWIIMPPSTYTPKTFLLLCNGALMSTITSCRSVMTLMSSYFTPLNIFRLCSPSTYKSSSWPTIYHPLWSASPTTPPKSTKTPLGIEFPIANVSSRRSNGRSSEFADTQYTCLPYICHKLGVLLILWTRNNSPFLILSYTKNPS